MEELNKPNVSEFSGAPAPVEIQGDWITLTQIVEMMGGFFSRETLRKRAQRGNAPFFIRRIGARYYARREDVEKYINEINGSK